MKKIEAWSILVQYEDGSTEEISDMPDDISQIVDDYLTELEQGE